MTCGAQPTWFQPCTALIHFNEVCVGDCISGLRPLFFSVLYMRVGGDFPFQDSKCSGQDVQGEVVAFYIIMHPRMNKKKAGN